MKNYSITFEQGKKKYHKARRTVVVRAMNSKHATDLVHGRWGSIGRNKMPSDKIIIVDIKENTQKSFMEQYA